MSLSSGAGNTELLFEAVRPLTWPSERCHQFTIECAGSSFVRFKVDQLTPATERGRDALPSSEGEVSRKERDRSSANGTVYDKTERVSLLDMREEQISDLTHYEILDIPMTVNADNLKRAYHRACLRYHPDKTGRGEDDHVFLAVKGAFDTLSDPDKRRSYDSSVDFDDSIPPGGESAGLFFDIYGPVFERNLRFAIRPVGSGAPVGGKGSGTKSAKGVKQRTGGKRNSTTYGHGSDDEDLPRLGDDGTPIEEVNAFYEYWTHFDSWRDFTLRATEMTEHDVDAADCREEKRWMAKEIDRKAKALKREEMARINLLVERAMAADPRLKRHREQEKITKANLAKERKAKEELAARQQKEKEDRERREKQVREDLEKERKAKAKATKEKEKKFLRKSRQQLRKLSHAGYHKASPEDKKNWGNLEQMNDDVELLCETLSLAQIDALNEELVGTDRILPIVKDWATEAREEVDRDSAEKTAKREAERKKAAQKEATAKAASAGKPFSKEELSALAKAVRKYPPGGANRWETIAAFVNNLLSPEVPRTKEECISQYNKISSNVSAATECGGRGSSSSHATSKNVVTSAATAQSSSSAVWSDEQDKQLQDGLKKFPNTMDKNERWTAIAKGVTGKTKKECVQRFKAIREALKKR